VDIVYRDGVADVSGSVADPAQRDEALRIVQGVPGVERVRDRITLASAVTQAQSLEPPPSPPPTLQEPTPLPRPGAVDRAPGAPGAPGAPLAEPQPLYQGQPSPYDLNPPHMPPYAWPTYAPYNNYSRVAYPNLYPYNAWPFVGPIYPFPKIPLGWRKVKLEWQDGYWWYAANSNSHDWWRLRYW
jgi:hypothetical protein